MKKFLLLLLLLFPLRVLCQADTGADSARAEQFHRLAQEHKYSNPELSKKYTIEAIVLARKIKSRKLEGAGYNSLGLYYRNSSKYDSAIVFFKKAITILEGHKEKTGYYNARNNLGMTYFYLGEYEKASRIFFEGIDEADNLKLYKVQSHAYQNLGIVNNAQDRYAEAIKNFYEAEKYYALSDNEGGQAGAANNRAFIYFKHLKQYDKAIGIYKKTIPVKQRVKDEKGLGIIYNNMAEIYLMTKNYALSLEYINKAIPLRIKLDDKYGLIYSYTILADIYLQQKKHTAAQKYAQLAVNIAKDIGAKKEQSDALQLLSKVQEATRDIAGAYDNLVTAEMIKDSLLNRENFARMAELETKYETEKKEREILAQRAQLAETRLKIDHKNNIIYLAFLLAVIIAMMGLLVYNRQKIKTVKLQKEAELKDALLYIETQNKLQEQRLQISRDLHDNIGSQLTFIISSLDNLKYGFTIANEGLKERILGIRNFTKETITELRDTIWAMNKEEISLLDLKTRITNFINNAKAASQGIDFTFSIDRGLPDTISFSSLKGINLYRIIQEAVHNALKHSGATAICVAIAKQDDNFIITISDNGKGFNPEEAEPGNGLLNINKRIKECGGAVEINSSRQGTTISVSCK